MSVSWGSIVLWVYCSLEAHLFFVYRRCIKKCEKRLKTADSPPQEVSMNVVKQLQVMPRIRTFYRDLFGASHHTEIKYGNIEKLFIHTIGTTSQTLIKYMIRLAEMQLSHTFEEGYNEELEHTYCKEDQVVRGRYMPALVTSSIITLKFFCDWYVRQYYQRIDTSHAVYWVCNECCDKKARRALLFMCGIGIGPITYFNLVQKFRHIYDVIIMVEIKWISFHVSSEPVADGILINDITHFVCEYLHKLNLGCYYAVGINKNPIQVEKCCMKYHHNRKNYVESDNGSCPCDMMMHSGGAV